MVEDRRGRPEMRDEGAAGSAGSGDCDGGDGAGLLADLIL